jgi:hypothetical protein
MKMGIHIVSWVNDAEWLDYCLRSIKRFCSGYHRVQVSSYTPEALMGICAKHGVEMCSMIQNPSRGDRYMGYLLQQVQKLYADRNLPDCDHVLFVDSDCIFTAHNSPESWLLCGKPILMIQPYSALAVDDPCRKWQAITEKALGFPCVYETMRRHPFCFPADVVRATRNHIEDLHQKMIGQYVTDQENNDFSEFNAIGSYAMRFYSQRFALVEMTNSLPVINLFAKVFTSWKGLTPEIRTEIDGFLK